MTPQLRTATPDDHEALSLLSAQAFTVAPTPFDPARRPYLLDDSRRIVAEADGRVVAHAGAWRFGQWFGGGRLACAGVAGVSVAPEHRGTGLGTAVVGELLRTARAQGDVIASLYPMNHRFYRSLGFGPGSVRRRDRVPTRELVRTQPPGGPRDAGVTIRPATADDVPGIEQVVARRARRGNGLLDHEARHAARFAGGGSPATYAWVAVDGDGTVRGHLMVEHAPAVDPAEWFSLSVSHLAADDVAVEAALWRLVGSDHPGARTAEAFLPPGCLPRLAGEREIAPVDEFTLMSRLLDVEGALLSRGWPAGADGELVFDVADPLFAENGGPLRLTVRDGRPAVDRSAPAGRNAVRVDVATLTSLVTGYLDPVDAAHAGLLPGATGDDLATLRRLLAGPAPQTIEFF